ncbi:MAG: hypothetical protein AAF809_14930 [Bacteroidota bacterium]
MRVFLSCALLLCLTGCRESLLTPEEGVDAVPPTDVGDAVRIGFLKGPEQVAFGESAVFKAPEDSTVYFYEWYQSGTGAFQIYSSPERVVTFRALQVGEVKLEYVAYGGNGGAELRGERVVQIVR